MSTFEVTVRWTLQAESAAQARLEAEILAKQGNHPQHGADGGTVVTVAPSRDLPPLAATPRLGR
jgi:hypothetical protein